MSIRAIVAVGLAACVLTSCGGDGKKPEPQPPAPGGHRNPDLTLKQDLFNYYGKDEKGALEFRKFAQHLQWKSNERERKCGGNNKCKGEALARMQIDAPEGVKDVDFKKVGANEQVLVGRLENTGDEEDVDYEGILPPSKHTTGYIVLVGGATGAVTPWLALYSYHGHNTKLDLRKGTPFYVPCNPNEPHPAPADSADFKSCTRTGAEAKGDTISPRDYTDALAWFSCTEGCCGSSFPPFRVPAATARPAPARKS
jgi:hypothetical protein